MTYQNRSKELDTCTTVIISQFMHAQTFSSSVLCQERLVIGIVYHVVLWKMLNPATIQVNSFYFIINLYVYEDEHLFFGN